MTERSGLDTPSGEAGESLWSAEDSAGYISRITKVSVMSCDCEHAIDISLTASLRCACQIYLSDVIDHLDTVLGNIDQYTVTTDHLTSFVFNVSANRCRRICILSHAQFVLYS
jgi:hypothetical protein